MLRIQTLLSLVALLALAAWAQANRGTITGIVTDPSGAVVAGAQVTATQVETGVNYSTVSTEAGAYSIVNLPTGTYSVRITFQGFKTFEQQKGIRLEVGQIGRVDAALQMGAATESVTVQEQTTMLATDNATVGTNINSRALTDLPLQISGGRNAETFAFKTMPGVEGSNYETHIQGSPGMSKLVLPAYADSNYFELLPGEKRLVLIETPDRAEFEVSLEGWNVKPAKVRAGS